MEHPHAQPSRRTVLKLGLGGLATVVAGGTSVLTTTRSASAAVVSGTLFVTAGERTMIDGLRVPVVGFGTTRDRVELPGAQIEVQPGDTVNLTITNTAAMPVGFSVPGVAGAALAPLASRARPGTLTFPAPAQARHLLLRRDRQRQRRHRPRARCDRRPRRAPGRVRAATWPRCTRACCPGPGVSRCSARCAPPAMPTTVTPRSGPGCSPSSTRPPPATWPAGGSRCPATPSRSTS